MHVSPLQSREKWEFLEIKKRKKQKETERKKPTQKQGKEINQHKNKGK